MDNNGEKIISGGNGFLLKATGFTIDGVQFLLGLAVIGEVLNTYITVFVAGCYLIWLSFTDRRIFKDPWNILYFAAATLAEGIPFLNLAPGWFIAIRKIVNNTNGQATGDEAQKLPTGAAPLVPNQEK